ncbi:MULTISPECIES: flagellar export chaperone FliS [unclassified Achromobacter]|uniref:flagellar export chaperone FliS n=1 Tax=unclassified Achromobacter TaxID=2626865 RepID=UPI000B517ADC|nr:MULTISPECIES: flagellar export chaperone FliS [unclassified Achromobacter]OWT79986.1 flagellar export chaperone FliS [Achromobacter sp. HZ34]OWT81870.1 flagellar export chaperone FliS [Achromobacter sp. HZ28]
MSYASRRPDATYSVRSYKDVGLETQVLSASPERLISLLYSGARVAIGQAKQHLEQGNVTGRASSISHAMRLVDEGLKQALANPQEDKLAANLDSLYDYILRQLVTANIKGDVAGLDEADRLLADLQDAWQTAVDQPAAAV